MDLKRKLELLKSSVESVARHDDEDAAVRHVALNKIIEMVESERHAMDARVAKRIEHSLK